MSPNACAFDDVQAPRRAKFRFWKKQQQHDATPVVEEEEAPPRIVPISNDGASSVASSSDGDPQDAIASLQVELHQVDVDVALWQERHGAMREIRDDMQQIAHIQSSLAGLVDRQDEQVDFVVQQTEQAQATAAAGLARVVQAATSHGMRVTAAESTTRTCVGVSKKSSADTSTTTTTTNNKRASSRAPMSVLVQRIYQCIGRFLNCLLRLLLAALYWWKQVQPKDGDYEDQDDLEIGLLHRDHMVGFADDDSMQEEEFET